MAPSAGLLKVKVVYKKIKFVFRAKFVIGKVKFVYRKIDVVASSVRVTSRLVVANEEFVNVIRTATWAVLRKRRAAT